MGIQKSIRPLLSQIERRKFHPMVKRGTRKRIYERKRQQTTPGIFPSFDFDVLSLTGLKRKLVEVRVS